MDKLKELAASIARRHSGGHIETFYAIKTDIEAVVLSAVSDALDAAAVRVSEWKDFDGSTGDDYDSGYEEANHDAIAAIRSLKEKSHG